MWTQENPSFEREKPQETLPLLTRTQREEDFCYETAARGLSHRVQACRVALSLQGHKTTIHISQNKRKGIKELRQL